MYVESADVKAKYNILLPDALVQGALQIAHDHFWRMTAIRYERDLQGENKTEYYISIPLNLFLTDQDFDWKNSLSDVKVFQYNSSTFVQQDIDSLKSTLRIFRRGSTNRLYVTFSANVPQTGYDKLAFEFYLTPLQLEQPRLRYFAIEYISMYALKHLLNTADVDKLQTGIAHWNLNGTDASVDGTTIRSVIKDIEERMRHMYSEFMPLYAEQYAEQRDTADIYFTSHQNRNLYTGSARRFA